jgi:lipoprotein-releasing system permease protein
LIEFFSALQTANKATSLLSIPVKPGAIIVSVVIATTAGTLAAFIPARRAARLSPIDVIRNG